MAYLIAFLVFAILAVPFLTLVARAPHENH